MTELAQLAELAQETRRRAIVLRTEMALLKERNAATRRFHLERRRRCDRTVERAALNRDRLPTWPAWSGPTRDIRSTLVSLE